MKTAIIASVSALALLALPVQSATFDASRGGIARAENVSGQLRMLSQEAALNYLLFRYHVSGYDKSALLDSVAEFDDRYTNLRDGSLPIAVAEGSADAVLEAQLDRVDEVWRRLKRVYLFNPLRLAIEFPEIDMELVNAASDPMRVQYVDRLSDELLAEADKLVWQYTAMCDETRLDNCSWIVNYEGRQRMLVHRMTKAGVFLLLGLNPERYRGVLEDARKEFVAARQSSRQEADNEAHVELLEVVGNNVDSLWHGYSAMLDSILAGETDSVDPDSLIRMGQVLVDVIDSVVNEVVQTY